MQTAENSRLPFLLLLGIVALGSTERRPQRAIIELVKSDLHPESVTTSTTSKERPAAVNLIENGNDFDKVYTKRIGETAKFRCVVPSSVVGDEGATVVWMHAGKPVAHNQRRFKTVKKASGEHVLRISKLELCDGGAYECVATANDTGTEVRKALLLKIQNEKDIEIDSPSSSSSSLIDCTTLCGELVVDWEQLDLPRRVVQLLSFRSSMMHDAWATQGGSITVSTNQSRKLAATRGNDPLLITTRVERHNGSCSCLAATLHRSKKVVLADATGSDLTSIRSSGSRPAPSPPKRELDPEDGGSRSDDVVVYTCGVYRTSSSVCSDNDVADAGGKWQWTVFDLPAAKATKFVCSSVAAEPK